MFAKISSVTSKAIVVLGLIIILTVVIASAAYYASLNSLTPQPNQSTPSPSPYQSLLPSPSPTERSTPTTSTPPPTTLPSDSPTNTPVSFTPQPTTTPLPSQTISPTTPPATPIPTHPPQGSGPSVAETAVQGTSVQIALDGLGSSEKADFSVNSNATLGNWSARVTYSPLTWTANANMKLGISIGISKELLAEFRSRYSKLDNVSVLLTAERDFDPQGDQHTPWDNTLSTILTPAGLPIEGGGSAAVSRYNAYTQRGPLTSCLKSPCQPSPSQLIHNGLREKSTAASIYQTIYLQGYTVYDWISDSNQSDGT